MSDSGRSGGSGRSKTAYRRVSNWSNVDETLFASNHHDSASKLRAEVLEAKRHISRPSQMQPQLGSVEPKKKVPKKATVISQKRLDDIVKRSQILSKEERERNFVEKEKERLGRMAKAEARKSRMRKLEIERKNKVVMTEEEVEDEILLNASLNKAADQRLEQVDQVKTMRRKMVYAQCAKIREAQIQAKKDLAAQAKAYSDRQDIIMEIDRLKRIKGLDVEEKRKQESRQRDAAEIRGQIDMRKKLKILEDERIEQEKQQMKESIKVQEREEQVKRKERLVAGKRLLEEVLTANDEAIEQKQLRKMEEDEEDERILQWQMAKRAMEEQIEAEKAAFKSAQDKQFFEVASKMKRSQDNRSEEDALRAKRHQQEQERRERQRERGQKDKKKTQTKELTYARKLQADRKVDDLKVLAIQDKLEWDKINRENTVIQAKHDEVMRKQARENNRHQKELRAQMQHRERAKEMERDAQRKEGEELRRDNASFLAQIEKKKLAILSEMRDGDIPDKFCAEVERMKIELS